MPPLAIVDPALGRTGAHNQGFAELLANLGMPQGDLGFWCNQAIAPGLRERLVSGGAVVDPAFGIDFYRLAAKPGGVAEHWDWIHGLACEYLHAFEGIGRRWPGRPVRVLHHTVSWEHATALSLAIRLLGKEGDALQHVVLLMYSPGVDQQGRTIDAARKLNFRLAFGALSELPGVSLHASCSEYSAAYAALLGRPPLPLHPCFLGDWRTRPARTRAGPDRILLYAGEIKQEKGFLQLPAIAARMLERTPASCRLVIQFVDVRNDAARAVLEALTVLAAKHERIELHHGFWDEARMHAAFLDCSVFRMDYDPAAYAHKTSGLLWLAAWFGLPVSVPPGTWLEREARRLGMPVVGHGTTPLAANAVVDPRARDCAYFDALFTPFGDWLASLPVPGKPPGQRGAPGATAESTGGIAVQVRAARVGRQPVPQGVGRSHGTDVVLFWKQNDTTLYGRRCDMVARYLASRRDVRKVVVIDAPIGEADLERLAASDSGIRQDRWIVSRTLEKLRGAHDTPKLVHRVFVYPAGEFRGDPNDGDDSGFIERYAGFLAATFAEEGVDPSQSVFWVYPRNLAMPALLERFAPRRVVVDVVDDHRAWPGVSEAERTRLTANYQALLATADVALANCAPVMDAMRAFAPGIRLVPNGCDSDPPRKAPVADEAFEAFRRHAGPTIGYVGNLEPKVDIALLSRVAERFPECQLVLIGSTHANPRIQDLLRHANVRMPGVVPYDMLGAWLARFDVGLVPHLETDLTRHMNPLKAYVYLSWGVPVVATAVPNVDPAGGLVQVAADHEAFLALTARVLRGERPSPRAFRDYVEANDWRARLSATVDSLGMEQRG